jgi:hypothetical protein
MAAPVASQPPATLDAVTILERRTPAERHAMARLLDTHEAIGLLGWLADRPDCDLATAAMIFWRLRSVPGRYNRAEDVAARNAVLARISDRCRGGGYPACDLAWDGIEAWERSPLTDAPPLAGIENAADSVPPALRGPFGDSQADPAWQALLDEDILWDDVFDAMWRRHPDDAGVADYLIERPADVWLAAIDDLVGSHADDLFDWMVRQPECPDAAAGRIAYLLGADGRSIGALPAGERARPRSVSRPDDFDYFCLVRCRGGSLPRPRAAAVVAWQASAGSDRALPDPASMPDGQRRGSAARAATPIERFCYGGKFTGTQDQMDRCWRRFNILALGGGALLVILMRTGAPHAAIWTFFALAAFVAVAQSSWKMGSSARLVTWWVMVSGVAVALAFTFRALDAGAMR